MNENCMRKDYDAAEFAIRERKEYEVRAAKKDCYAKVGRAARRKEAAIEAAWDDYRATALTKREGLAALNAALYASEAEYKASEAEAIREHNRLVYPATSAAQVAGEMARLRRRAT